MHIRRVRVEEGFLDGLDLRLVPGLNVVIGARGTGKTSLIELIRFCLDVKGYTGESNQRSVDHARSILDSGEVTVDIEEKELVTLTRQAEYEGERQTSVTPPIIFSQMEIESIGLEPSGRLRLIDSFIDERRKLDSTEGAAAADVRSLTSEAHVVLEEIDELEEQLGSLPHLEQQITELLPSEQRVSEISADAARKKLKLDELTQALANRAVASAFVERYRTASKRWKDAVESARQAAAQPERWTGGDVADPVASVRHHELKAAAHLKAAADELAQLETALSLIARRTIEQRHILDEQSRELRSQVEGLQEGAGSIVRQGQQLRERKAQLESLRALVEQRRARLMQLINRRNTALEKLEDVRGRRFQRRAEIVKQLSANLGPRIQVEVERAGQFDSYARIIADSLRGSGLRYQELSKTLAQNISPRELLEAVENHDFDMVADVAGISRDRATRVLDNIRRNNIGEIVTTLVEDNIYLKLLDGNDYKDFNKLSTGQRCTVVLPIILEHKDRVVIIDQPEDHIDNAFIVETLIKALSRRSQDGQIIISTHNANIPVLANADLVVQMGSDGRRGFVENAAPLDTPRVVRAILAIMEGGAEAFERRARFYGQQHA